MSRCEAVVPRSPGGVAYRGERCLFDAVVGGRCKKHQPGYLVDPATRAERADLVPMLGMDPRDYALELRAEGHSYRTIARMMGEDAGLPEGRPNTATIVSWVRMGPRTLRPSQQPETWRRHLAVLDAIAGLA